MFLRGEDGKERGQWGVVGGGWSGRILRNKWSSSTTDDIRRSRGGVKGSEGERSVRALPLLVVPVVLPVVPVVVVLVVVLVVLATVR